jgi:hypothetical protein
MLHMPRFYFNLEFIQYYAFSSPNFWAHAKMFGTGNTKGSNKCVLCIILIGNAQEKRELQKTASRSCPVARARRYDPKTPIFRVYKYMYRLFTISWTGDLHDARPARTGTTQTQNTQRPTFVNRAIFVTLLPVSERKMSHAIHHVVTVPGPKPWWEDNIK